MIYLDAITAEEISLALRGRAREFNERIMASEVADRLLGKKKTISGTVVTAPRRSGKTTELLRYAKEKYPYGQFAVVCISQKVQEEILRMYRLISGDIGVTPPLILTPENLDRMRGQVKPILCDEWNLLPYETRDTILNSGLFVAAVTSE